MLYFLLQSFLFKKVFFKLFFFVSSISAQLYFNLTSNYWVGFSLILKNYSFFSYSLHHVVTFMFSPVLLRAFWSIAQEIPSRISSLTPNLFLPFNLIFHIFFLLQLWPWACCVFFAVICAFDIIIQLVVFVWLLKPVITLDTPLFCSNYSTDETSF